MGFDFQIVIQTDGYERVLAQLEAEQNQREIFISEGRQPEEWSDLDRHITYLEYLTAGFKRQHAVERAQLMVLLEQGV